LLQFRGLLVLLEFLESFEVGDLAGLRFLIDAVIVASLGDLSVNAALVFDLLLASSEIALGELMLASLCVLLGLGESVFVFLSVLPRIEALLQVPIPAVEVVPATALADLVLLGLFSALLLVLLLNIGQLLLAARL